MTVWRIEMSGFIQELSQHAISILSLAAAPLLIWTMLVIVVLLLLRSGERLHVLYHYQLRLACLVALPAGLVTLLLIDLVSAVMAGAAQSPLKLIVLEAPLELVISEGTGADSASLPNWFGLVLFVYGSGLLVMLGRLVMEWIRLRLLNRSFALFRLESLETLSLANRRLAASCRSAVRVAFSREGMTPVTYGWSQPVIVIPASLIRDSEKLNLVVRHELMHVRNGDYGVHLLASLIRAIFWFHPLVYLLHHQLVEYREMRCDSLVLSDPDISRKAYASVLLELLPLPGLNRSVSVNMAHESSNLKQRINKMKIEKRGSIPIKSSLSLFCGLTIAVILLMSCADIQQNPGEPELAGPDPAEDMEPRSDEDGDYYTVVEEMPELIGGLSSLQERIQYPESAKQAGKEGRVYVQFIVNEEGEVENPRIMRGIGGGADEAALEAVSQATFKPGRQRGQPVRVQYALPIVFKLNAEDAEP